MELTYHWEGDYLIPDISLGDGSSYNIGKYGRMRQKYLCEITHQNISIWLLLKNYGNSSKTLRKNVMKCWTGLWNRWQRGKD